MATSVLPEASRACETQAAPAIRDVVEEAIRKPSRSRRARAARFLQSPPSTLNAPAEQADRASVGRTNQSVPRQVGQSGTGPRTGRRPGTGRGRRSDSPCGEGTKARGFGRRLSGRTKVRSHFLFSCSVLGIHPKARSPNSPSLEIPRNSAPTRRSLPRATPCDDQRRVVWPRSASLRYASPNAATPQGV